MKQKLAKNRQLQKEIPKRSRLVKQFVKDAERSKKTRFHVTDGCYKEAEDRFEAWAGKLI